VQTPSERSFLSPFLSIVIPALNEANRLPATLQKIEAFLATQSYAAEVVIVENGSADNTVQVVQDWMNDHPYVRLFAGEPRGKGRAVKRGMLEARGEYRFICDADLSMPIEEVAKFLPPIRSDYDVAIGSREVAGAKRIGEPAHRHFIGRINNLLVKLFAVNEFEDTQCGFKMFHRTAAEDLFSVQRMNGIGFDVELLYIALRRNYKILEVPVNWYYNAESKMKLIQDSLAFIREMFEIRRNWKAGLYAKK
jgi:glycosyltransferase involved in cell wall biosynthesis